VKKILEREKDVLKIEMRNIKINPDFSQNPNYSNSD
jgi:hypothetical protein